MSTQLLTATEAIVMTASVQVHVMTLRGKQVTLSVFRQLQEESIFNPNGTLKGTVWGTVNYHWGECTKRHHTHAVWQDGDSLRRATIENDPPGYVGAANPNIAKWTAQYLAVDWLWNALHETYGPNKGPHYPSDESYFTECCCEAGEALATRALSVRMHLPSLPLYSIWSEEEKNRLHKEASEQRAAWDRWAAKEAGTNQWMMDGAECERSRVIHYLIALGNLDEERCQIEWGRAKMNIAAIAATPQLFIAI